MVIKYFFSFFLLVLSSQLMAQPDIRVNGLFSGKAVLTINGAQQLLKEGETSPEGVKLIASDSKQAVILVNGKQLTLKLSQQISANYTAAKVTEVKIPSGSAGHYWVGGAINGRHVRFMVDTGASVVAMNSKIAEELGIQYQQGQPGHTSTAGGIVKAYYVDLPKITVGNISLPYVKAAVLEGDFPQQILLGNSFLSRVEMREENGTLVLKKEH